MSSSNVRAIVVAIETSHHFLCSLAVLGDSQLHDPQTEKRLYSNCSERSGFLRFGIAAEQTGEPLERCVRGPSYDRIVSAEVNLAFERCFGFLELKDGRGFDES